MGEFILVLGIPDTYSLPARYCLELGIQRSFYCDRHFRNVYNDHQRYIVQAWEMEVGEDLAFRVSRLTYNV